ncbi:MAG: 3-deoxy-manno-octulosonate cytidylyltransferase [Burkholderiaceae bacterium]|nr:3-deoxy-manno-octulosonate cytidylyltransferase [Burkholderiaceae bacterium]
MNIPAPNLTVLIPARLASTRLPYKPLADVAGLPLIVRVAQQVMSTVIKDIVIRAVVACDSAAILTVCQAHGIEAVLTRADHPSGSDRLAEACELLHLGDDEIVVNVQGDEPLLEPQLILDVATLLQQSPQASMSTAAHVIDSLDEFRNPNVVKVVLDAGSMAMYFSRAPIGWWRDGAVATPQGFTPELPPSPQALRHIGIYAYRVGFLKQFPKLAQAPIEVCEALEQLRALWHGHRIAVHVTAQAPGPGVDTPEDLARVRALFALSAKS